MGHSQLLCGWWHEPERRAEKGRIRVACRRHPFTGQDVERERTLTALIQEDAP
ncbi:hypothetical protein [Streptosporangium sandarakinum]|uniref:hypothetical protein n=1 Tax=Streptosporangium sandarakinum TaxID=1260955 RepID=UPI0037227805